MNKTEYIEMLKKQKYRIGDYVQVCTDTYSMPLTVASTIIVSKGKDVYFRYKMNNGVTVEESDIRWIIEPCMAMKSSKDLEDILDRQMNRR